jgi:hypothetical protein
VKGRNQRDDDERLLRRLAPFLIAGLQAPLPDLAGDALIAPTPLRRPARPAARAGAGTRLSRGVAP